MKNAIRILAIASAVIMALTLCALVVCIVFQGELTSLMYGGYYAQMAGRHYSIPVGNLLYTLGALAAALVLCFTAGYKQFGIWLEVLLAVCISAVLPGLRHIISVVQTALLNPAGEEALASFSAVQSICSMAMSLTGIATAMVLVACGMSIAVKRMENQQGAEGGFVHIG